MVIWLGLMDYTHRRSFLILVEKIWNSFVFFFNAVCNVMPAYTLILNFIYPLRDWFSTFVVVPKGCYLLIKRTFSCILGRSLILFHRILKVKLLPLASVDAFFHSLRKIMSYSLVNRLLRKFVFLNGSSFLRFWALSWCLKSKGLLKAFFYLLIIHVILSFLAQSFLYLSFLIF
jgi:hypothetical protein